MTRHVKVQDLAALVFDEETVQHSEGGGRHREEVEGDDRLAVVAKKCKPLLGRIAPALNPPQVARDSPLREQEANSPWIFGAPQPVFSCAKRRINARSSGVILGRPARGRDFQRQYRRKPARCQPPTGSGLTMTSASRQRDQNVRKTVKNSRSRGRNG